MHDQHFPESTESSEQRAARAVAALEYEESAGLGFRRRRIGKGDPYGDPERYQVGHEATSGEILAGYLAGAGVVAGGLSLVMRPLLMGLIAIICLTLGSVGGGQSSRIAKVGLPIAMVCFFIGMLFAILAERKVAF
jgi:hypothetical protein